MRNNININIFIFSTLVFFSLFPFSFFSYILRQTELQTKTRIASFQERGSTVPSKLWEELRGEKRDLSKAEDVGGKENYDDLSKITINIERERAIMKQFIRKQDKLLFVCFHILLNLAEDVAVEYKMVKRKIARFLTAGLGRTSAELLILAVTFLKKLSIYQEGKDRMVVSFFCYYLLFAYLLFALGGFFFFFFAFQADNDCSLVVTSLCSILSLCICTLSLSLCVYIYSLYIYTHSLYIYTLSLSLLLLHSHTSSLTTGD